MIPQAKGIATVQQTQMVQWSLMSFFINTDPENQTSRTDIIIDTLAMLTGL